MTDSRLKGEWLYAPTFFELSDRAWRLFTGALMWSNEQGTDGRIRRLYFDRLLPSGPAPQEEAELLGAGLLLVDGDDLVVPNWDSEMGQSTAAAVEERRRQFREASAKYRASRTRKSPRDMDDVNVDDNVGVGPGPGKSLDQDPGSYVNTLVNVDANGRLICIRHPNGDVGEACFGCKQVREAGAGTPTPSFAAWQATLLAKCSAKGHNPTDDGRRCTRCASELSAFKIAPADEWKYRG